MRQRKQRGARPQPRKQKKSGNRGTRNTSSESGLPPLSECAAKYAIAIADPWNPAAEGACVPTHPSRPSQKHTAYRKGTVVIGANGFGFVTAAPCLANDQPAIWHSNSDTFIGSVASVSVDSPATGVGQASLSMLPYAGSDLIDVSVGRFQIPVAGRVVSASLTLEYTGTELDRAGSVVCFVDPAHSSVAGLNYGDIESRRESSYETSGQSRSKCTVSVSGLNTPELQYPEIDFLEMNNLQAQLSMMWPYSEPLSTSGTSDPFIGAPMMIIWVTGVKGSTWHYEYIQHSEFIGTKTEAMSTHNVTDARGFELVSSAANLIPQLKKANPRVNLRKIMRKALMTAAKAATSKQAMAAGKALLLAAL